MSIGDKITDLFLRNPVAWFLLALLVAASYWNFEHLKELDAVCEAIEIPPLLPTSPRQT
jgi:CHASE3 domain sensor protein